LKALIQRVNQASVSVDGEVVGKIGQGFVVLVGIASEDTEKDIDYLVDKIAQLRIFSDADGKFNISALEIGGEMLLISQFTLLADTRKGRRPSFVGAAPPQQAESLFNLFVERMRRTGLKVATGRFQAHMLVEIHNDGPVTVMLDSRDKVRQD
jgi:D-tyrosyl-tRNA(Tyr) deacylase